jgi:phosphomannomutase/phosphoglucomutase
VKAVSLDGNAMARLFGTNGIRWRFGGDKGADYSLKLGLAIGTYFGPKRLCLGMDSRTSSPLISNSVLAGVMACGCEVLDLGLVPTPVIQFAVPRLKAAGGIMVTGSHNPPEFNGLKCLAADGTELARKDELEIEAAFERGKSACVEWDKVGNRKPEANVQSIYKRTLIAKTDVRPGKKPLSAVVDCANGTAGEYTPDILERLGCKVHPINVQPDGRFPARMPEPTEKNVGILMKTVKSRGSDFGVAHDGDADRATFVDEKGSYVTGDQSLALFAIDALKKYGGGIVIVPINTSQMVSDVAGEHGGRVVFTPIGSPFIARQMMAFDAAIGGEGNGGVIFPDFHYFRDGIVSSAKMAELLAREGTSLSALVDALPEYHLCQETLKIPDAVSGDDILKLVKKGAEGEVITVDGVKESMDGYWRLVRLSGTEPIVRVTVESGSEAKTMKLLKEHAARVKEIIDSLSS